MIIDGKALAKSFEIKNKELCSKFSRAPKLIIVRVGNDSASVIYTNNKLKAAKRNGIDASLLVLDENISQEDFEFKIYKELCDLSVNGVIVQLPLPYRLDIKPINAMFDKFPTKDVDGFSTYNVGKLNIGNIKEALIPCTASAVVKLIKSSTLELKGKVAMIIGRSNIVGKPVARLLEQEDMTVIQCHSYTKFTKELCSLVDILVVAVGKAECINTKDYPNCKIFIDVGINRNNEGKVVGDILDEAHIKSSENKYITPVPGGVGPMTVQELMQNTIKSKLN